MSFRKTRSGERERVKSGTHIIPLLFHPPAGTLFHPPAGGLNLARSTCRPLPSTGCPLSGLVVAVEYRLLSSISQYRPVSRMAIAMEQRPEEGDREGGPRRGTEKGDREGGPRRGPRRGAEKGTEKGTEKGDREGGPRRGTEKGTEKGGREGGREGDREGGPRRGAEKGGREGGPRRGNIT